MARYDFDWVFQVTDVNGDVATVRFPSNGPDTLTLAVLATDLATLATDLSAATNGKITRQGLSVRFSESAMVVGTSPPTNAEYSSVTDGARMQFATADGQRTSLTIPAPIEALFGASSNVVDSTNAHASALIADVATNCVPPSGSGTYNLYKGGIKVGKRARLRRSSLVP